MTRYRCVDAQQAAGFAVSRACEAMRISTSALYAWRARGRHGPTSREQRDAEVLGEIREIHDEHPDYGSPRVTAELARRGTPCNHKKVETMMRNHRIVARRHRRRRGLTTPDPTAPAIPDLVGRLFDPDDVDHTWAGDVTYIPTDEGRSPRRSVRRRSPTSRSAATRAAAVDRTRSEAPYGTGPTCSATTGPASRRGCSICSAWSCGPHHDTTAANRGSPWRSSGMNGSGGAMWKPTNPQVPGARQRCSHGRRASDPARRPTRRRSAPRRTRPVRGAGTGTM